MSAWTIVAALGLVIAALAAFMAWANLRGYRRPPRLVAGAAGASAAAPLVSICVPARNEAANLEACVDSLLSQRGGEVEVLVYDDHSTDGTGAILARLVERDARVRAVPTRALPPGWNGKQFGCQTMGDAAQGAWLLFTDADVRFEPDAVAMALGEAARLRADLISTFPREITGSFFEHLVVPLIHFIVLSYLPFAIMRQQKSIGASAGCGQFLLVRREWWARAGGHAAFRDSMHDGIRLPRAVRAAGGRTDLFDGTHVVRCRMYRGSVACWRGFAKNAYEGLGSFAMLLFFTVLHLLGHVAPWVIVAAVLVGAGTALDGALAAGAIAFALAERGTLAARFRQSWLGVLLHPLSILLMTAIQWHSFALAMSGRREWRGRRSTLPSSGASGMLSRDA